MASMAVGKCAERSLDRLCLAVIIALPAATPKEFRNSASYALGNFTNGMYRMLVCVCWLMADLPPVSGWPNGFAFILSFLSPLWTICEYAR